MTILSPILLIARGAVVLALALVATRLLRRAPASLRATVLGSTLAAVLALPVLDVLVPVWHAGALPGDAIELAAPPAPPIAEVAVPAGGAAGSEGRRASAAAGSEARGSVASLAVPWRAVIAGLWAAGIAAMLLRAGVGALRAR